MDSLEYLNLIRSRAQKSRIYRNWQLAGLAVADMLGDRKRKTFYIRLAKTLGSRRLFEYAGDVAQRKGVKNKGAYLMRILERDGVLSKALKPRPRQLTIRFRKRRNGSKRKK
jgi:hypothetical protein